LIEHTGGLGKGARKGRLARVVSTLPDLGRSQWRKDGA